VVTRIDPGVVSLVAELRGQGRQRPRNWPVEDASRGAQGDRCHAGGDYMSQALNRLRAMVSLPSIPRQYRGPRAATADGWRDRLESDPSRGRRRRRWAIQASADCVRWNLGLIFDHRGADMADLPDGASGLLVRDYKGNEADRLVTRIDAGVVSLVAELRAHERQAAQELDQWTTRVEERKALDASPAAITLELPLTDRGVGLVGEEGWRWRNRGARTTQVEQMSQALNRLRVRVSLPKFPPPMPRPS
jgi:hypothetical protein